MGDVSLFDRRRCLRERRLLEFDAGHVVEDDVANLQCRQVFGLQHPAVRRILQNSMPSGAL
jgi:hypothetical protein